MTRPDLVAKPVVLFDFDGTVVDTQPAIIRVASQVLVNHGMPRPTTQQMLPIVGPPLEEGFMLVAGIGPDDATVWAAEYRALFDEVVTPEDYPVLPGMRELLDDLHAQGRRLAVATSRMEDGAVRMVAAQSLTQFGAVCGRVPGVRNSKAASIAAALEQLGATPADAVMVGDRHNDVEGAREVGLPCVGIYNGAAAAGEHERAGAAAVAHAMSELRELLLG